jgi:hypothetical protein
MITLPATFAEAQALAFAKERIAIARSGDFFDPGYSAFHPDAGRVFLRRMMGDVASLNGDALLQLIDFARAGFGDADTVLREMIVEHHNRGESLSPFLATYAAEIVSGRGRGLDGPKPATYFVANLVIVIIMIELMDRFGLNPTRYSKRRPSASSVMAQALTETGLTRGSEAAIAKIWQLWGQRFLRNWPDALRVKKSS